MTTWAPPSYHLGKAPAKTDPRTFRLADYLLPGIPPPPISVDNSQHVGAWQMLGNDQYGDCVVAAHAHNLMLWAAMAGVQFSVTAQEVIQEYLLLSHGIDSGLVVLDTLNFLRKNFWKGKEILGFASVDPRSQLYMQHAIAMFGSVYRGVLLPQTAQSQVGSIWDFVPAPGNAPGSWGGHAVIDVAYDQTYTKTITWGLIQRATYRFWTTYCDEAFVIIPTDPIPGFNRDAFIRDLQSIGQYVGPLPDPPPPPPPPPITVVITPASATVQVSSMRQFSASVPVSWTTDRGAISASGLYTAPSTAGSATVVARSIADPTRFAQASVSVTAAPVPPPPTPSFHEVLTPGGGHFVPQLWISA